VPAKQRDDHPQRPAGKQQLAHQGTAVQHAGGIDEDIQEQGEQREVQAHAAVVAPLEELRHGVGLAANDGGQQEQAEEHQDDDRRPFVVVNGNADGIGAAGEAHQCRRGHVGGQQRQADHRPGGGARRQKIVRRTDPPPRHEKPQHDEADGVDGHHQPIEQAEQTEVRAAIRHFATSRRPRVGTV
jgi:hypothetical protein